MKRTLLITGGAGFIGSNLAYHFLKKGYKVTIFDSFKRTGTRKNADWIADKFPDVHIIEGDIRDSKKVNQTVQNQEIVFHLAAQVAVTTSVVEPRPDFEINASGTFNVLEAARNTHNKPIIIFASTNKVYGEMTDIKVKEATTRYAYANLPHGISEKMNLDFHSPYGCSKGAADQYVKDYCRIYGLPTVVFRQSCIYGPRQFGVEDQGWVAWFIIATALGKHITIYGDGKQVRDILYIDDLVRLFETAVEKISIAKGKVYNIGGGIRNTLAVWQEFKPILEKLFKRQITVSFSDWRPGDQKIYISDIRLVEKELGWEPKIHVEDGIRKLYEWIIKNHQIFL